jgi:zinc protease
VAGAFDPVRVLKEISTEFGRLAKPTRKLPPTYTLEPVQEGEREVTLRRIGGQQAVFASYHIPALAHRDYAAFEIVATALADTPSGRLHKRLVEAGKATQVFGWASRNAEPGLLSMAAVMKKEDSVDDAQRIFISTIEGLIQEPVTAEELKRAQPQWARDLDKIMSDPQTLCVTLSEASRQAMALLFSLRDRAEHHARRSERCVSGCCPPTATWAASMPPRRRSARRWPSAWMPRRRWPTSSPRRPWQLARCLTPAPPTSTSAPSATPCPRA